MSKNENPKKLSQKNLIIFTTRVGNFFALFFGFSLQKCSATPLNSLFKYIILST